MLNRRNQLDGDQQTLLDAAAEKLHQAHPLAATISLRTMVAFTLRNARSSRYGHAARHPQRCERLSHRDHACKSAFWKRMQELGMAQVG